MKKTSLPSILATVLVLLLTNGILVINPIHGHGTSETDAWKAPPEAINRTNPVKPLPESIERGKVLFMEFCTSCHGSEAKGDGPVSARLSVETPDLTEVAGMHTDGDLAWKISTGKSPMPKWSDKMTEQQIWDLVNFIQNLKP